MSQPQTNLNRPNTPHSSSFTCHIITLHHARNAGRRTRLNRRGIAQRRCAWCSGSAMSHVPWSIGSQNPRIRLDNSALHHSGGCTAAQDHATTRTAAVTKRHQTDFSAAPISRATSLGTPPLTVCLNVSHRTCLKTRVATAAQRHPHAQRREEWWPNTASLHRRLYHTVRCMSTVPPLVATVSSCVPVNPLTH